jgi:hypothetical protein
VETPLACRAPSSIRKGLLRGFNLSGRLPHRRTTDYLNITFSPLVAPPLYGMVYSRIQHHFRMARFGCLAGLSYSFFDFHGL